MVYAFARQPKWIVSHLFVLVLVLAMVAAGLWQLERRQDKRDRNVLIVERQDEPVAPVDLIVDARAPTAIGDDIRFRRATATGTYDGAAEVLVRNRSFDEAPGSWVLTPLVLDDGTVLVVNRGWVPLTGEQELSAEAAPPDGRVQVEGLLEVSQSRGGFGPTDPSGEVLDTLSRVDLDRYQEQVDGDLFPVWLQLESQEPAVAATPTPVRPDELDDGPHLSYAVQWGVFATIALVGYPLILRRRAHQGAPEG